MVLALCWKLRSSLSLTVTRAWSNAETGVHEAETLQNVHVLDYERL